MTVNLAYCTFRSSMRSDYLITNKILGVDRPDTTVLLTSSEVQQLLGGSLLVLSSYRLVCAFRGWFLTTPRFKFKFLILILLMKLTKLFIVNNETC